jgi:hypothetical protein
MGKVDSLLVAFEPEWVALGEEMLTCLEVARGHLKAFVNKAAWDLVQFTMALVKSHDSETDLDPVGEGVATDCTEDEWKAHFTAVRPLTEQIMGQVNL